MGMYTFPSKVFYSLKTFRLRSLISYKKKHHPTSECSANIGHYTEDIFVCHQLEGKLFLYGYDYVYYQSNCLVYSICNLSEIHLK